MRFNLIVTSWLLLLMLAIMPLLLIMLQLFEIGQATAIYGYTDLSDYVELESTLSKVWTVFAAILGITIILLLKNRNPIQLSRSGAFLLALFFSYTSISLFGTFVREDSLMRTFGTLIRIFNYLIVAPVLTYLVIRHIRNIPQLLYGFSTIVLASLFYGTIDNIEWTSLTSQRTAFSAGIGGLHNSLSEDFMAILIISFILAPLNNLMLQPIWLRRYIIFFLVASIILLVLVNHSRGAMLALAVTLTVYYTKRFFFSKTNIALYLMLVIATAVVLYLISDFLYLFFSRQGQLADDLSAGRLQIWGETVLLTFKNMQSFIFGFELPIDMPPAHNLFIGTLQRFGVIAALAYIAMVVASFIVVNSAVKGSTDPILCDVWRRAFAALIGIFFAANSNNAFFLGSGVMTFLYFYIVGLAVFFPMLQLQNHEMDSF